LSWVERREIYLKILSKNSLWKDNHSPQFSVEDMNNVNIPTRAISLMFNMRSNDVPLGLPFNLASYGLLLEIFAKEVNMIPDELIASLGDAHIYLNQIDGVKEQISRVPFELPKLKINFDVAHKDWECLPPYNVSDFTVENYKCHLPIKMPLSN